MTKAIDLTSDLQMPLAAWRCCLSAAELYDATHRSDQAATSRATALQILKNLAESADEGMGQALLRSKTVRDLGG